MALYHHHPATILAFRLCEPKVDDSAADVVQKPSGVAEGSGSNGKVTAKELSCNSKFNACDGVSKAN